MLVLEERLRGRLLDIFIESKTLRSMARTVFTLLEYLLVYLGRQMTNSAPTSAMISSCLDAG